MNDPIFEAVKASHDAIRSVAKIEAREEVLAELRKVSKPTKQLVDIIKRLETNAGTN